METSTKVLIGTAAALAIGGGIYWFFIREGEAVAGAVKEEGSGGGGGGGVGFSGLKSLPNAGNLSAPIGGQAPPRTSATIRTPVASSATVKTNTTNSAPAPAPAFATKLGTRTASLGANGSKSWSNATGYIC